MKKFALFCAILTSCAWGQGVRYDNRVIVTATNVPATASAPLLTAPNAVVTVCATDPTTGNCTGAAQLFSNPHLTVHLPSNILKADAQGRFGFWAAPGTYSYGVVSQTGQNLGSYAITLGSTTSGSGLSALTRDVTASGTGSQPSTVVGIGGQPITGIVGLLKITNGSPSVAHASDVGALGTLTNNTTGSSASAATASHATTADNSTLTQALATTPAVCPTGKAVQGVDTQGNPTNCLTVAGGGGISALTNDVAASGTGSTPATVIGLTGHPITGITGLLKLSSGVPTAATASDVATIGTLSNATSGNAATSTTAATATALSGSILPSQVTGLGAAATHGPTTTINGTPCTLDGTCTVSASSTTVPVTTLVLKSDGAHNIVAAVPAGPSSGDIPTLGVSYNATGSVPAAVTAATTSGHAVIVEPSYTGTLGASPMAVYPHLGANMLVATGNGIFTKQFKDGLTDYGNAFYPHDLSTCENTVAFPIGGVGNYQCNTINLTTFGAGVNHGNAPYSQSGWSTHQALTVNMNTYTQGIDNGLTMNCNKSGVGDHACIYIYSFNKGGFTTTSDEGEQPFKVDGGESSNTFRDTIGSYASGVLTYTTNPPDTPGTGLKVIDITSPVATGYVTSIANWGYETPGLITTTDTHAASTFTAKISGADVSVPNTTTRISTTFSFSGMTGTLPSVGAILQLAGDIHQDSCVISAVTSSTITCPLLYAQKQYTSLYVGGIVGCIDLVADRRTIASTTAVLRTCYPIVGSTATGLYYRSYLIGNQSHIFTYKHTTGGAGDPNAQYVVYYGADVESVDDNGQSQFAGTLHVAPNNFPWTVGDSIEQPHSPAVYINGGALDITYNSPTTDSGNNAFSVGYGGPGVEGNGFNGIRSFNQNPVSMYLGQGGSLYAPGQAFLATGSFQTPFYSYFAPSYGGNLIFGGRTPNNCDGTSPDDTYNILLLQDNTGLSGDGQNKIVHNCNTGTTNWILPGGNNLQVNSSLVCTVANGFCTGGGAVFPSGTGVVFDTAGTGSIATPAQLATALRDPTKNGAVTFATGSSGDSTLPSPATGLDLLGEKAGTLQWSHNGGAYSPLTSIFDLAGAGTAAVALANVPTADSLSVTYGAGQQVYDASGNVFESLTAGNFNNALPVPPVLSNTYWRSLSGANSPLVQVNSTSLTNQSLLNLLPGTGITLTPSGGNVTIASAAGGANLQTNGTTNSTQSTLDLNSGSSINLSYFPGGHVYFAFSGVFPMYQETLTTPASSTAACTAGQFTDDANYHYVCVSLNVWKRVALAAF